MFQNLDVFQISYAMAKHAGQNHALIAQNVANSDTPGYLPMHLPDFKSTYRSADLPTQKATRAGHINGSGDVAPVRSAAQRHNPSPNGNAVSVEQDILASVNATRQHERALTIYKSALTILHNVVARN